MAGRDKEGWKPRRGRLTILDSDVTEAYKYCQDFQPNKRGLMARLNRRLRDKMNSKTDDLLPTRHARMKRNRRRSLKLVMAPPRKVLGSRLRKR